MISKAQTEFKKWLISFFLLMTAILVSISCVRQKSNSLEKSFIQPPASAQMRVFWWWLESNISKEGITRDLEEMKKKGIGGALLYDGGSSSYSVAKRTPAGPPYLGAKWRELFKFALKEANRLDIEITLNAGGSGWNVGGPWVTPEFAAQKIVFSDTEISGPISYSNSLPLPTGVLKDSLGNIIYYRDVAVLAYHANKNTSFPHKPIKNW
ncbi:MAG: hypothetical protein GXO75_01590, partial [Calditrichaeota bacterium]|nr:hypothetical protein [Calditrichota bacterium]